MTENDVLRQALAAASDLLSTLAENVADTTSVEKWNEALCRYVLYRNSTYQLSIDLVDKVDQIMLATVNGQYALAATMLTAYIAEVQDGTRDLDDLNKEIIYELPIGTTYPPPAQ